jgi:hypothetical protein
MAKMHCGGDTTSGIFSSQPAKDASIAIRGPPSPDCNQSELRTQSPAHIRQRENPINSLWRGAAAALLLIGSFARKPKPRTSSR